MPRKMGRNGYLVAELPKVGDDCDPVCTTGCVGINSYGLEMVAVDGAPRGDGWWAVICYSDGSDDGRTWKVVAVIPEEQWRHIARWMIGEIL